LNATAPAPANQSVIRSIIDGARMRENTHEAGPWTKAKMGSNGALFPTKSAPEMAFSIPEDTACYEPIPYTVKYFDQGIQLPSNFVCRNNPQTQWKIPLVIEDAIRPCVIPLYDKFMLYPKSGIEMSSEELRAYKYHNKNGNYNNFTRRCDEFWKSSLESGIRMPPGFFQKNEKQIKDETARMILEDDHLQLQVQFKKLYPDDQPTEFSQDEVRVSKWKNGLIKQSRDDDDLMDVDMEETIVGDRRQSIHPRKSMMPRKSILSRKSVVPVEVSDAEVPAPIPKSAENRVKFNFAEPAKNTGCIRKSIVKRKVEEDGGGISSKTTNNSETPPRSHFAQPKFNDNNFVKPQIPIAPIKNPGIFEDDAVDTKTNMGFDQNETCNTQQFNFFLKAQSVSTPVASKKPQRLCPDFAAIRSPSPEPHASPNVSPKPPTADSPIEQTNCQPSSSQQKQLSTIYETTENTQSTKSSVDSPENEDQSTLKKSMASAVKLKPITELSFKFFEDKTETVPNILFKSVHEISASVPSRFNEIPEKSIAKVQESFKLPEVSFMPEVSFTNPQASKVNFDILEDNMGESENVKHVQIVPVKSRLLQEIPVIPEKIEDSMSSIYASDDLTVQQMQMKLQKEREAAGDFKLVLDEMELKEKSIKPSEDQFKFNMVEEKSLNISASQNNQECENSKLQEAPKSCAFPFEIFEDRTETQARALLINQNNIDEFGGISFHTSRKENFFQPIPQASDSFNLLDDEKTETGRKISDEFYELTKTPVRASWKPTTVVLKQNSLKFDDEPGPVFQIENAMHISNFEKSDTFPSISTSIPNIKQEKSLNIDASIKAIADESVEPKVQQLEPNFHNLSISLRETELPSLSPPKFEPVEFKVPEIPFKKPEKKKQVTVVEEMNEEPVIDDDLSRSIYVQRPVILPETPEKWEEIADDFQQSFIEQENCYQHSMTECDYDEKDMREMMDAEGNNPFSSKLRQMMLEKCNFIDYLENHIEDCLMLHKIKPLARGDTITCGKNLNQNFIVEKLIGKGSYGSIFKGRCAETAELYALKQERPANLWEYYINCELFSRLKHKDMLPAFMRIEFALIANNASVFVSKFSPYGSLIDVCNKVKARTNRNVDEYVAMTLTTHILSIIDHLHSCKIIHADCKPDNFLLMEDVVFGSNVPPLQLIDFGVAIDMDWYEEDDNFKYVVNTENFTCTEMMENRPWTYQTDLFGVAGTAHVLLMGKYMDVKKRGMQYEISSRLPRYFNRDVWDNFFLSLLNIKSGRELPNLQELKNTFNETLLEKEKFVCNKIDEFNNALK
jgi:hypothetical protein